jgi:hypothetical protein
MDMDSASFIIITVAGRKNSRLSCDKFIGPGEKLFIDFCDGPKIIDESGKKITTQLFVAIWGVSNYTFVRAVENQQLLPKDIITAKLINSSVNWLIFALPQRSWKSSTKGHVLRATSDLMRSVVELLY